MAHLVLPDVLRPVLLHPGLAGGSRLPGVQVVLSPRPPSRPALAGAGWQAPGLRPRLPAVGPGQAAAVPQACQPGC